MYCCCARKVRELMEVAEWFPQMKSRRLHCRSGYEMRVFDATCLISGVEMNGLVLVSALLLVFFAGTEQACLLGCSCQLDGVIDCRDLGLTALQTETEVVDRTVETVNTAASLSNLPSIDVFSL